MAKKQTKTKDKAKGKAAATVRTPKTTIPGVYAIMFRGFNREELQKRARHIVGVGSLTLSAVGVATITGLHNATNSPMTGQRSTDGLHNTTYALTGSYVVTDDGTTGNPIQLKVTIDFTENGGPGRMKDTFQVVQSGPDRFWLVSTNPVDNATGTPTKVDELVYGEAVKVTDEW